ncbi:MAG: hypothetical protein GY743_20320 [Planctomycetaceae bacterium]|nr:hypothetical protein [Planctomycetaceae bacterium]
MSDAEKTEMEMQDRILYSKFAAKFFRDHGPIKPHEWPDEWQAEKTYNNLGSLVKLAGGPIVVDEALKNLIERLEPGVHQFSPIKITMPKGQEYPKQYYAFVISQFRDSFSPEDSDEGSWRDESFDAYWGERIAQYYVNIPQKKYFEGLAMRREVFGSSHIWRESKLQTPEIFLSDTLNAEIINAGLRVPKTFQLKEA